MMIQDKHIAEAKKWSWETLKQMLGVVVVGGGLIYAVAAPWAESFIREAVAGSFTEIEQKTSAYRKKTDIYIVEQTKRTNEIKNQQAAILENQRIREGTDRETRRNINEILRLMRNLR